MELDNISTEITGGGQTILNLGKAWLDDGNNVDIIMPRKWRDYLSLERKLNKACILKIKKSPEKSSLISVLFTYVIRLLQSIRHITKLISAKNIDLVFTDDQVSLIAAYIAGTLHSLKYRKKPVTIMPFYSWSIVDINWTYIYYPSEGSYKRELRRFYDYASTILTSRFARRFVDYFFTESTYIAKLLNKNLQIPYSKTLPIGGGIDYDFIKKEGEIVFSDKRFDACFIGRIHPSKGVFDLVNAWNIVRDKIPDAKLVMIGGGYPYYGEKLEGIIKKLNLSNNVILCGYVSEEDKFKILTQSKFLVHPSYGDCIPLTFFEAASVGVPIITYYLPTYENVRDYIISVKRGNIKQLAATLTRCISKYNANPEVYSCLIESEMELAKRHSWRNIAKAITSKANNLL